MQIRPVGEAAITRLLLDLCSAANGLIVLRRLGEDATAGSTALTAHRAASRFVTSP
jgi:hypothetical protein